MIDLVIETELGNIVIGVDTTAAPETSAWFLNLVDQGTYAGASFYRSGASFVSGSSEPQIIQGGIMYDTMTGARRQRIKDTGVALLKTIESTSQTGLTHQQGTVSFARDLFGTGFVIPELFICLTELPPFDEDGRTEPDTLGFPAFGKVIQGMDIVRDIARRDRNGPTTTTAMKGQILSKPVKILEIYRI